MKIKRNEEEGSKAKPVVPKTIAGMLTTKRYAQLRKMGITTSEIAALCMMHERGQYPGARLFTSTKKKEILASVYRKLRHRTQKEIELKYQEMRMDWVKALAKAKTKLEAAGVDFEAEVGKTKELKKEIKLLIKDSLKNRTDSNGRQ